MRFKGSNLANHFNFLPPDSLDAAMATGELSDNRSDGVLPDDGDKYFDIPAALVFGG